MRQSFLPPDVSKKGSGLSGPATIEGTRDLGSVDQTWLKLEVEDSLRV